MIEKIIANFNDWVKFEGKTLLISGATGMIGSLLVDTIMTRNHLLENDKKSKILAIGRNSDYASERFPMWMDTNEFSFISHDISNPLNLQDITIDYFIHAASTTHPVAYATEPINTILSNIFGVHNLLELAKINSNSKFLLISSVEIYGENRGDVETFNEKYCGYINCNTLRAGYPESKRASESLCQAYISAYDVNVTILRLPRTYGPTMRQNDSKAIAQFIKRAIQDKDIILKSEGTQLYSYSYVADAVLGMLTTLASGKQGEAYNLADKSSDIMLKDLANIIAAHVDRNVIFELPDETEKKGFSTATKAILDSSKLSELGWTALYNMHDGLCETIDILKEIL